ncbi:undecaprenyldiphospho-muramoylpentapeptide beta-N-acetylglucosaminyltransferase [Deferrisoma sp.]
MRLLIAGGGTGGHLFPGIAVAQELLGRPGGHEVAFAGTEHGIEARVVPARGFRFFPVRAAGVVGKGPAGALRGLGRTILGLRDAAGVIRSFRPGACLGVGGYASVPVLAVARARGIFTAVQEQNAWPGLANRVLGRWAHRVFLGFEEGRAGFPAGKAVVTGNPLRPEFAEPAPYPERGQGEPLRILVLGGSQGARTLNRAVPGALGRLTGPVEVLHQAGPGRGHEAAYGGRPGVRVVEFVDDMASAYAWCHLVVARAGALTVGEVAAVGRPAVFVPYPHAAGGHQEKNARAAEAAGWAVCLADAACSPERLAAVLEDLAAEPGRLRAMADRAAAWARRDAAARIVDKLLKAGRLER